jgi:small conductance mechanosensitive channel
LDFQTILNDSVPILTAFGLKLIGAVAIWVVGRWLIGLSTRAIGQALRRQNVEETLIKWLTASLGLR